MASTCCDILFMPWPATEYYNSRTLNKSIKRFRVFRDAAHRNKPKAKLISKVHRELTVGEERRQGLSWFLGLALCLCLCLYRGIGCGRGWSSILWCHYQRIINLMCGTLIAALRIHSNMRCKWKWQMETEMEIRMREWKREQRARAAEWRELPQKIIDKNNRHNNANCLDF